MIERWLPEEFIDKLEEFDRFRILFAHIGACYRLTERAFVPIGLWEKHFVDGIHVEHVRTYLKRKFNDAMTKHVVSIKGFCPPDRMGSYFPMLFAKAKSMSEEHGTVTVVSRRDRYHRGKPEGSISPWKAVPTLSEEK
eukprot:759094-Hanusia_phi.AAC.1